MVPSYEWISRVKSRNLWRCMSATRAIWGVTLHEWSCGCHLQFFVFFCADGLQWRALEHEIDFLRRNFASRESARFLTAYISGCGPHPAEAGWGSVVASRD